MRKFGLLVFLLVVVVNGFAQRREPELAPPEPIPQSPERDRLQHDDALRAKLALLRRDSGNVAAANGIIGPDRDILRMTAWAMLRNPEFMKEYAYNQVR